MKVAKRYGVSADALMFAEEPHMRSYFVTRKGQGLSVERTKAYKYQSLASGFANRKAEVFIVTVEPKPNAHTVYKNTHPTLTEGDSIYFDSSKPHGMLAVGDQPVKFLAFTVE